MNIIFKVTNDCMLKCPGCYAKVFSDGKEYDFDFEKIDFVLEKMYLERCIDEIIIHGGEPLLIGHENMEALLMLCSKYCSNISLQSNLILLDDEFVEIFKKFGVSVGTNYRGTPDMYERMCGRKINEWLKGVMKLKENNIYVGGLFYYTPDMVNEVFERIDEIVDFAASVGLFGVGILEYIGKVECNMRYSEFVIKFFEKIVERNYRMKVDIIYMLARRIMYGENLNCCWERGCLTHVILNPNGEIKYCFGREKFNLVPDECLNCEIYGICKGGCEDIRRLNGEKFPYCDDYKKLVSYVTKNLNLIRRYYQIHGLW